MFTTVAIESPYAGEVHRNLAYLRAAMQECLLAGEAPFASHALYTQPGVLNDDVRDERMLGITAGFALAERMDKIVFYTDLGWSKGMILAKKHWEELRKPIEVRELADRRKLDFIMKIRNCGSHGCDNIASMNAEYMGYCPRCFDARFPRM